MAAAQVGVPIPPALVDYVLLGPADDRRQLQDSPILGDVWVEFGQNPAGVLDLLIAPYRTQHAGAVAAVIGEGLGDNDDNHDRANIAYLQGLVIARLSFQEVLQFVVPKTKWWIDKWPKTDRLTKPEAAGVQTGAAPAVGDLETPACPMHEMTAYTDSEVKSKLDKIIASARNWRSKSVTREMLLLTPLDRFVALSALILWAGQPSTPIPTQPAEVSADPVLLVLNYADTNRAAELFIALKGKMLEDSQREPLVWQVSLNRAAMPALSKSVPAVKADAAKTLFKVDCSEIAWAVLDCGIAGNHPALQKPDGTGSRIKRSFDFQNFRRIVSLGNSRPAIRRKNAEILMRDKDSLVQPPDPADVETYLERLAHDAEHRGPLHWELVERFVEIRPDTPPNANHGTHVAGILGASKAAASAAGGRESEDFADGMCPNISLYDFRVLGQKIEDAEFAIIAALQFIRYLNDRDNFYTVHGANLSLSIPHDVRNFACGRTPICAECERLVESGVVVVAAAGNHGYKSFETDEGAYRGYAAFSITDPGNADDVITVGATHRFWPHTYGVSFFSSRGPTGDGRIKPDLVAPGERIRAPIPGGNVLGGLWGDMDGTSMAAPHVSGAAAMLMARYSELIGQPRRIKRILCESATDLGRERSFQGHGMLDVLRAFQSI